MKKLWLGILFVTLCGLASTADLSAHHGAAQFDEGKPVTLSGFVTKVDWRDPHVYFYLNAKDDSGKVESWRVETSSKRDLVIAGWPPEKLKIGTELTITGILAKPDSGLGIRTISSRYMVFAIRKPMLIGPSI
jgi:hypothetical protein